MINTRHSGYLILDICIDWAICLRRYLYNVRYLVVYEIYSHDIGSDDNMKNKFNIQKLRNIQWSMIFFYLSDS